MVSKFLSLQNLSVTNSRLIERHPAAKSLWNQVIHSFACTKCLSLRNYRLAFCKRCFHSTNFIRSLYL